MTTEDLEAVLARILGISDGEMPLPARYQRAKARLADALARRGASSNVSVERIAAYAAGALEEDERRTFEGELASSEARYEVASSLDFLAALEARRETAPARLLEAVRAVARDGSAGKVAGLVQAVRDRVPLTVEQMRGLITESKLRETVRCALLGLSPLPALAMPALAAAASDTEIEERAFPGGRVRSRRVRDHEIEVLFSFDEPGKPPHALWLEGPAGEMWLEPLPSPFSEGEIFLVKDLENEAHSAFARLLRDPSSIGEFLP